MHAKALMAAVAVALGGMALMYLYMTRYEEETSGGAPVYVVIAAQEISIGTVITEELLGTRTLPQAYIEPRRHIMAEEANRILGVRANKHIHAGESVLWSDVAAVAGENRDLAGLLRPGQRAYTIEVDESSSFSGLLNPGDRVDIYVTITRETNEPITYTLLQNVMVLAAGHNMQGASRGMSIASATMSVSVEQAQLLSFAKSRGRLSFALRHPEDLAQSEHPGSTTMQDITNIERLRQRQDSRLGIWGSSSGEGGTRPEARPRQVIPAGDVPQ